MSRGEGMSERGKAGLMDLCELNKAGLVGLCKLYKAGGGRIYVSWSPLPTQEMAGPPSSHRLSDVKLWALWCVSTRRAPNKRPLN